MNAQTIQEIADTQMYKGFSLETIEQAWDRIADPNDVPSLDAWENL